MEGYNECPKYHSEFKEYAIKAFLTCLDEITQVMKVKGVDITLPNLTKLMNSFTTLELSYQKIVGLSSGIV